MRLLLRRLRRSPVFALLNVAGLAVGLTCALLVGVFVWHELSYDRFYPTAERVVRVVKQDPGNVYLGSDRFALTPDILPQTLVRDLPAVERAAHVSFLSELTIIGEGPAQTLPTHFASQDVLDVFGLELLSGDARTALDAPGAIVLTETEARRLFGERDPVGQPLAATWWSDPLDLTVTGVIADPPANTHFRFASLTSHATRAGNQADEQRWQNSNVYTYALLRPGPDRAALDRELAALAQRYLGGLDGYRDAPERVSVYFSQPLTELHLRSNLNFEMGTPGSLRYTLLVAGLGLLILGVAAINYVNLVTARGATRAGEMGMRKALGAGRARLAAGIVGEAAGAALLAFSVAVAAAAVLLPSFSGLVGRSLSLGTVPLAVWVAAIGAVGLLGVAAGAYPAALLARLDPVAALRGGRGGTTGSGRLRDGLVVAQLAAMAALLIATLTVQAQVRFVGSAETGVDRAHVVSVPLGTPHRDRYPAIREAALRHPAVLEVAGGPSLVDVGSQTRVSRWSGSGDEAELSVFHAAALPGLADVFGLERIAGSGLDAVAPGTDGALVNETFVRAARLEGLDDAWVELQGREMPIVGVVRDFHFQSLHQPIAPFVLYRDKTWFRGLQVRLDGRDAAGALAHLEAVLADMAPGQAFSYTFADEAYDRLHRAEVQQARLFGLLTALAVVLAAGGLIGLAAFVTRRRLHEVAVRKALGATVAGLALGLGRRFAALMALAFVVAAPVAVWAMQRWLDGFAYRVELGPLLVGGAALLCLALTLGVVGVQIVRAARISPAHLLRSE